jgi:glycosyltransferase involved in cell wall biosynthesis
MDPKLVEHKGTNQMNEQVRNKITSTEKSTDEKPLVTFALFAYNQEEYIREAIQGAFSQTYHPLEIILSDDFSTDRTFDFMQEMAESYAGPHTVHVRRNRKNIGVFSHVVSVAKEANGALFILSAGDDISKQNRVSELVKAWQASGAWGLHSKYDVIDNTGLTISNKTYSQDLTNPNYSLRKYFFLDDGVINIVHGATSAYNTRLFDIIEPADAKNILSEDGALSLILNLFKFEIVFLEQSLVKYRRHSGALTNIENKTNNLSLKDIKIQIKNNKTYTLTLENRARLLLNFSEKFKCKDLRRINTKAIKNDIETFELRNNWHSINLINRIILTLRSSSLEELKWLTPRLFGQSTYAILLYFKYKIKSISKLRLLNK